METRDTKPTEGSVGPLALFGFLAVCFLGICLIERQVNYDNPVHQDVSDQQAEYDVSGV